MKKIEIIIATFFPAGFNFHRLLAIKIVLIPIIRMKLNPRIKTISIPASGSENPVLISSISKGIEATIKNKDNNNNIMPKIQK